MDWIVKKENEEMEAHQCTHVELQCGSSPLTTIIKTDLLNYY